MIVYARNFNYYCSPFYRESAYDNKMHRPSTLLGRLLNRLVPYANARVVGTKPNPRSLAFVVRVEHMKVCVSLFNPHSSRRELSALSFLVLFRTPITL